MRLGLSGIGFIEYILCTQLLTGRVSLILYPDSVSRSNYPHTTNEETEARADQSPAHVHTAGRRLNQFRNPGLLGHPA